MQIMIYVFHQIIIVSNDKFKLSSALGHEATVVHFPLIFNRLFMLLLLLLC